MSDMALEQTAPFFEDLRAIALAETHTPPPRDAVLFYGSSSIRLWSSLAQDFAGLPVINHGFGGSTIPDCIREIERLVFPVQPRAIVLYAGDNDLDQGTQPEEVLARVQQFVHRIREHLRQIPLVFLSVKPSPIRFWNIANIRRTNALVCDAINHGTLGADIHFLDVFHSMINGSGEPRRELFDGDGLHMTRAGYDLWTPLVRERLVELGIA